MNEKHAREARIVNRIAGTLVKKSKSAVIDAEGNVVGYKRHKLPRAVKRAFAAKTHREKGKLTRYWRSGVAHSLKARGVTPKGEDHGTRRKSVRKNKPSRHVLNNDRKILNGFRNDLEHYAKVSRFAGLAGDYV